MTRTDQPSRGTADELLIEDPVGAFRRDTHVALEGAKHGPLEGLTFGAKDAFHIAPPNLVMRGTERRRPGAEPPSRSSHRPGADRPGPRRASYSQRDIGEL